MRFSHEDEIRVGSLFSGYGGLDLAVLQMFPKATLSWVADPAPGPSKVLAYRHPGVPNLGDVTEVDWAVVPQVEVLTAGTPCQDLSVAGSRLGMTEGTRSNLWVVVRKAIDVLQPKLVIWENVQGALSARASSDLERDTRHLDNHPTYLRALGRVLGDLGSLGYDCKWRRAYMPPRREPFTKEPASSSQPRGAKLLPTPTVSDAKGTGQSDLRRNTVPLRGIPLIDMSQYAEAIAHQEGVTGVPAPEPTVPNRNGREKLNPAFVEWMMMLPPGYVTEVPDITDTAALMLLGNGVVPPQAVLALESLLDL